MRLSHSMLYRQDGSSSVIAIPPPHQLKRGAWGVQRQSLGAADELRRLEDTPFYTRSQLAVQLGDMSLAAMHEQLDLQRYRADWVQFLLPFRMRRVR